VGGVLATYMTSAYALGFMILCTWTFWNDTWLCW